MIFDFDRTIPNDDIGFEILNNLIMLKRETKKATLSIFDFGMTILSRGGDYLSRNRVLRFENQVHLKVLYEEKAILICQFKTDGASLKKMCIQSVKAVEIRWRITSKGILYFCKPGNSRVTFLFAAHFFDRFMERGLIDDVSRVTAIGKFLWYTMNRTTNKRHISTSSGHSYLFCNEGAALGHLRIVTNRESKRRVPCLFFKTFISREMFSPDQRKIEGTLARRMDPLNFEIFSDRTAKESIDPFELSLS
jgi:hypothetical protein